MYGGEREREKNGGLKKKKKKSFAAQVFFTTYLVTVHTSPNIGLLLVGMYCFLLNSCFFFHNGEVRLDGYAVLLLY